MRDDDDIQGREGEVAAAGEAEALYGVSDELVRRVADALDEGDPTEDGPVRRPCGCDSSACTYRSRCRLRHLP